MPPKLRNQAKPENSNQPTLFQQWRFRTKPSHPSESPNVQCEKLFLQLWRTVILWDNIAGLMKYIRYIGRPRDKNRVLFRMWVNLVYTHIRNLSSDRERRLVFFRKSLLTSNTLNLFKTTYCANISKKLILVFRCSILINMHKKILNFWKMSRMVDC